MKCRSCKSCQRERMPNLPKVNSRCLWTVRSLIFNDMAIARLDAPWAASCAISIRVASGRPQPADDAP